MKKMRILLSILFLASINIFAKADKHEKTIIRKTVPYNWLYTSYEHPGEALKGMRSGISRSKKKVIGYKLLTLGPDNVLRQFGFKQGDIITTIDNSPLNKTVDLYNIFMKLRTRCEYKTCTIDAAILRGATSIKILLTIQHHTPIKTTITKSMLTRDKHKALRGMRLIAHKINFTVIGYRVDRLRTYNLLYKIGLRKDDIILMVDGKKLNKGSSIFKMLASLYKKKDSTIYFQRNKKITRLELTYTETKSSRDTSIAKTRTTINKHFKGFIASPYRENGTVIGYRLMHVHPATPLYKLKLRSGDVLLKINNKQVTNSDQFEILYTGKISRKLTVILYRNGRIKQLTLYKQR